MTQNVRIIIVVPWTFLYFVTHYRADTPAYHLIGVLSFYSIPETLPLSIMLSALLTRTLFIPLFCTIYWFFKYKCIYLYMHQLCILFIIIKTIKKFVLCKPWNKYTQIHTSLLNSCTFYTSKGSLLSLWLLLTLINRSSKSLRN